MKTEKKEIEIGDMNRAMREPPKLQVTFLGMSIVAQGIVAIGAALLIVMLVLVFNRF